MAKAGRKTKLTPTLCDQLCKHIENGNYAKTACLLVGISEETYYKWKKKGEESKSGKYVEFLESIKKAEKKADAKLVSIILAASEKHPMNWTAAAWLLERRNPEEWGNREELDITHHTGFDDLGEAIKSSREKIKKKA